MKEIAPLTETRAGGDRHRLPLTETRAGGDRHRPLATEIELR